VSADGAGAAGDRTVALGIDRGARASTRTGGRDRASALARAREHAARVAATSRVGQRANAR